MRSLRPHEPVAGSTAFGLWRQTLGTSADEAGEEAVRALAHQAVLARKNADNERAVERLSLAALSSQAAPEVAELAKHLEDEILLDRLVSRLFPKSPDKPERPGRHRVLLDVVERSQELRSVLLSDDEAGFAEAWWSCLARCRGDVELHHALAVLCRERALGEAGDGLLVTATAMWAVLMSTAEFWDKFGDFDSTERADLIDRIVGELLERNVTVGCSTFDAGETKAPAAHLRLLADCEEGAVRLIGALGKDRIPWGYRRIDETAMERISKLAEDQFRNWCADIVRSSESSGQDYEERVGRLEAFVRLGVPVPGVALAGLQRCNEWVDDIYPGSWDTDFTLFVKNIESQARVFADQLVSTGRRGIGYLPENQELSRYFNLQGGAYFSSDPDRARRHYRESLSWNPSNGNAKKHLSDLDKDGEGKDE